MIEVKLPKLDFEFNVELWHELEDRKSGFVDYIDGVPLLNEEYYTSRRKLTAMLMRGVDKSRGGVYIIKSADGVMYVGKSSSLYERILQHLRGSGGATSSYVKEIKIISGFHVDDPYERDIYETYAVKELSPYLNINKRSRWV